MSGMRERERGGDRRKVVFAQKEEQEDEGKVSTLTQLILTGLLLIGQSCVCLCVCLMFTLSNWWAINDSAEWQSGR